MIARRQRLQFARQKCNLIASTSSPVYGSLAPSLIINPKEDLCRAFFAMRHPLFEYRTVDLDVLV